MTGVLSSTVAKLTTTMVSKEVDSLQKEVTELRRMNNELQKALHASQTGSITMKGYLYKHRPAGQLLGLFAQEWELRYCLLVGTALHYYKSDSDAASFDPRGVVQLQGCHVMVEGQLQPRQWVFGIADDSNHIILRLASDNRNTAEKWLAALENIGLPVRTSPSPGNPSSSNGSSRRRRGKAATAAADEDAPSDTDSVRAPSQAQQDRWEACSTDSEIPEVLQGGRARAAAGGPPQGRPMGRLGQRGSSNSLLNAVSEDGGAAAEVTSGVPAAAGGGGDAVGGSSRTRSPMVGSTPLHVMTRYSFLSSDGVWTAKHGGLLNLAMVILIVTNFRLILENLLKYGLRMHFFRYITASLHGRGNLLVVLCFPGLLLASLAMMWVEVLGAYFVKQEEQLRDSLAKKGDGTRSKAAEKLVSRQRAWHELVVVALEAGITTLSLMGPCWTIWATQAEAGPAFVLTLCTLVVWMKLVSYAHCHADLRKARRAGELRVGEQGHPLSDPSWALLQYPRNLTAGNLLFYLAVPSLVYQVNFPRSKRIRKRWLLRRLAELACFVGIMLFITNQYLEPAMANSIVPLSKSDWPRVLERVLKLALPTLYVWLAMFYCLFHLWLNILAELTQFGDREFYKDWWNAATVGDYWKLWNMPVHKWLLRTVYFPAMAAGVGRYGAMVLVFFVSAVFHELAVGVPLHMLRATAFLGIMLQVPLISITEDLKKRLKSDTWGNYIFWVCFCIVGQPVCLMMYYHDYVLARHNSEVAAAAASAASAAAAEAALGAAAAATGMPGLAAADGVLGLGSSGL